MADAKITVSVLDLEVVQQLVRDAWQYVDAVTKYGGGDYVEVWEKYEVFRETLSHFKREIGV